jgi:hypothetical protein
MKSLWSSFLLVLATAPLALIIAACDPCNCGGGQ